LDLEFRDVVNWQTHPAILEVQVLNDDFQDVALHEVDCDLLIGKLAAEVRTQIGHLSAEYELELVFRYDHHEVSVHRI
jgi:hypothetical protein